MAFVNHRVLKQGILTMVFDSKMDCPVTLVKVEGKALWGNDFLHDELQIAAQQGRTGLPPLTDLRQLDSGFGILAKALEGRMPAATQVHLAANAALLASGPDYQS